MERTAIVTGGTRGLGRAIAVALRDAGYRVAAVYCSNDAAAASFTEATSIPIYKWDVADFDACKAGVAKVEGELGAIDVLVNNAGITHDAMFHNMTQAQWRGVLDTNLGSMFNMCRNVIEGMRQRRFGRIVNISSVNAQKGQAGQANYSASKAGILGFTRTLALEGARRNITVNAIAPGYCDTDMVAAVPQNVRDSLVAGIPLGRFGTAEEIARAVLFLVDDKAGFITGATLPINGGQYMN